jgi:CRP/FNR family transcriptional regulator
MPFDSAPSRHASVRNDCLICPVQSCLGRQGGAASEGWSATLAPRHAVIPGAPALFAAGDRLRSIYSVRAGCLKTYTVDAAGNEHIRGFHLPGDMIGLDALYGGRCRSTVAAVVPSQVCIAPLAELGRALAASPPLAQQFTEQASRELAQALAVGGSFTAEQRLAAFLLHMEGRLGLRDGLLRLPMPQRDIGSYLRLATETVCRTLKQFVRDGLITQETRGLCIVDRKRLAALGAPVGLDSGSCESAIGLSLAA